jgi:hypothetical protein
MAAVADPQTPTGMIAAQSRLTQWIIPTNRWVNATLVFQSLSPKPHP